MPPIRDGAGLSSEQADRVDFPSSVWAAKQPVRDGVLVPPLEDGPPLSHVGRETIGHTSVGSNKCRHCAISLCVVSEMDQKSGNNYVLRCMLLIKRLIVLVVGKDGEKGALDIQIF